MASEFMTDRLWPFTKVMRIFLDAKVLSTGVVLADLPGLHDVNLAKVRATERYLSNCDHVLAVAKISRAMSDQALLSTILSEVRRRARSEWDDSLSGHSRVTIVCTRAEEMEVKAHRREFVGPEKVISPSVIEQLDRLHEEAKAAKDAKLKKAAKLEEKQLLMRARNSHVTAGIQKLCVEQLQGRKLKVFCIANKDYWKRVDDADDQAVLQSNVPALRRHCQFIAAPAQLLESKNFLLNALHNLLQSVTLWRLNSLQRSQPTSKALEQENLNKLSSMEKNIKVEIRLTSGCLENLFQEELHGWLDQRRAIWENDAQRICDRWAQWRWNSYKAWCRNDGTHDTPVKGAIRWNNDLISKMAFESEAHWKIVEVGIDPIFSKLTASIRDAMASFRSCIQDTPNLVESIEPRIQKLTYDVSIVKRELRRGIQNICRDASEDHRTSFFVEGMRTAYRGAFWERGKGTSQRQISIIRQRIMHDLFPFIIDRIQEHADDLIQDTLDSINMRATDTVTLIREDLNMAYSNPKAKQVRSKTAAAMLSKVKLKGWEQELKGIRRHVKAY